jgi:hypothetical protein
VARRFLGVYSWIGGPIVDFGGLDKHVGTYNQNHTKTANAPNNHAPTARKGLMILYPQNDRRQMRTIRSVARSSIAAEQPPMLSRGDRHT